ncbi:lipopolysaccharide biosynthesis protein [Roseomonas xinghualingensis]|uniref:lipopolysaccharide biosynthesis protein n=1 Tax=Roseomonas xinghualingensis TaxID=2986475 RepID=UPI0021F2353F|nr:lipopolysaccharide biosynthesis protein [Roseomonas sp. SXEYE001]MCV4208306.1 lipopolysaccharide biosynthesis protein [Roseomonas sp. SXEYE001]
MFSFGEKYGSYALGLLATVILSRLLTPKEFGLFTVGYSVVMLIDILRDFGVGNYLVQEREASRQNVRSAFTLALILSLFCSAVLFAATPTIVAFYDEPGLARVIPLFAANFLLLPFSIPSLSLLRRDLAFDVLAGINLLAAAVNLLVVTTLAMLGHGYMSLAWAMLAGSITRTVMAFAWRPYFWAFQPSFAEWRKVASFGGYSTASGVINVLHDSLPQLILGRILGLGAVGLFSRATMLCQLPDRLVISALQPVILPALADHVRKGGELKQPYLLALTYMTALQWPILLCLALLADPIIWILFGEQWMSVAPLVRFIALGSLCLFPAFMTYPLLVSIGHIRDTVSMSLISLPPSMAIIFAASFLNLEAVAAAQFINAPLQVYVALSFIRRRISLGWGEIALAIRSSVVVALCAAAPPAAAVAMAGFRFDLSIQAMLFSGTAAVIGWGAGLLITSHPLLGELRNGIRVVARQVGRWA